MTTAIADRIAAQGLVAVIRCRAPLAELLEVGDALLATPLTVLAIAPGSREPWTAIDELRTRFGRNMLIGAGPLCTLAQVRTALDAGAQFVLSSRCHAEASQRCAAAGALYVPAVATPTDLRTALDLGQRTLLLFPAPCVARSALLTDPAATGVDWLALGGVTAEAMPALARRGVRAIGLRGVLPTGVRLDQAALIRRLRAVVRAWQAVQSDG